MTEQDFLTSDNPAAMLSQFIPPGGRSSGLGAKLQSFHISNRRLRLFACACCRACWSLLTDARSRRAVEVAESFADWLATAGDLWSACDAAHDVDHAPFPTLDRTQELHAATASSWCASSDVMEGTNGVLRYLAWDRAAQAALLREVVGCPHRPVVLWTEETEWVDHFRTGAAAKNPFARAAMKAGAMFRTVRKPVPWLTPSVQQVAHAAYAERGGDGALDAGTLAVLADAAEEAGCTDESLLRHLRGEEEEWRQMSRGEPSQGKEWVRVGWRPLRAPHVRGCHVLDAIAGKE